MTRSRRIVILVYEGCQSIDAVGPAEVFVGADQVRPGSYEVTVTSPDGGMVRCGPAVTLGSTPIEQIDGPLDTLLVAGGFGAATAANDQALLDVLLDLATRSRRVASVCSGALLLAADGLLDGRRATTHWAETERLAAEHPEVRVDPDPIYVRDGKYWTSAGVTAGLDLALALVADDLGDQVARSIAQWMVMFLRRPGGQSQFSPHFTARVATTASIRAVQDWIPDHLDADLSVAALARRAALSDRHFARRFRDEVGLTPAAHVTAVRMEAAKALLVEGCDIEETAIRCGLGTVESFHRAFRRTTSTTPDRYRKYFATTDGGA